MAKQEVQKLLVSLPLDVKAWLEKEAEIYSSSQSSEIVRALRERMQRTSSGGVNA